MDIAWQNAVDALRPLVVKISTPNGSGTEFLLYRSKLTDLCAIATAAHVIDHAHYWEQPIRLDHFSSGQSKLIRHDDRGIVLDEGRDTAAIIVSADGLPLPAETPDLWPEGNSLKAGNEVGWLGFPAVSSHNLCFFSGRVSCYLGQEHAYLIDGVAINGVSGGPTFFPIEGFSVIGVVSAYIPNRATGEALPGLAVVRDVAHLQECVRRFRSIDEAKENESQPAAPPPPNPEQILQSRSP